jgi:hypothetical protein
MSIDTDDIRKRCKYAIRNTSLGLHLAKALDEIDELRTAVQAIDAALTNSGCDISPCTECRIPVVCLPEGMALCRTCAEARE